MRGIGPLTVAILAGGRGQRLGGEKARVMLGGRPFIQHVMDRVGPLADELLWVARADQALAADGHARVIHDLPGNLGLVAAMATAIRASRHPWVWIVGCDMPFVSPDLLRYQWHVRGGYDVVVPRIPAGLEPLHGLYHRRCLSYLLGAAEGGERRVGRVISRMPVRYVTADEIAQHDPSGYAFVNINSPQDLEWAEGLLAELAQPAPPAPH